MSTMHRLTEHFRRRGVDVSPPDEFEVVRKANDGIEGVRRIDALLRVGWIVQDGNDDALMHPEKHPGSWATLVEAERIEAGAPPRRST